MCDSICLWLTAAFVLTLMLLIVVAPVAGAILYSIKRVTYLPGNLFPDSWDGNLLCSYTVDSVSPPCLAVVFCLAAWNDEVVVLADTPDDAITKAAFLMRYAGREIQYKSFIMNVPSVEALRTALAARGITLSCSGCGDKILPLQPTAVFLSGVPYCSETCSHEAYLSALRQINAEANLCEVLRALIPDASVCAIQAPTDEHGRLLDTAWVGFTCDMLKHPAVFRYGTNEIKLSSLNFDTKSFDDWLAERRRIKAVTHASP